MKLVFLILVHKNARQVAGLIDCLLRYPHSEVLVHVDLKSPEVYAELYEKYGESHRVKLIAKRYKVFWGSYGQVMATHALMAEAASIPGTFYGVLLSGQDMPIKPVKDFAAFLERSQGRQFLVNFRLPDNQWQDGGMNRLGYYHVDIEGHSWLSNRINAVIRRLQDIAGLKRRVSQPLYGGSNWFNLSSDAVRYFCDYIGKNPKYLRQFRHSRCADEIFVQSVIMNSPIRESVVPDDLRMIDWGSGPEFPRVWRLEDLERLLGAEDKFFARKFEPVTDAAIIKALHERFSA
jgi:hypothetical protein